MKVVTLWGQGKFNIWTEAQLDPWHTWIPGQNRIFLKQKWTFDINPAMSPTLKEKQKDVPSIGAFFSFSAKVQNYAGIIQKVHFCFKKIFYFGQGSNCSK